MKRRRRRCPVTGKHQYRDHDEAVQMLHYAASVRFRAECDGATTRLSVRRAYPCDHCPYYHLTSVPDRYRESFVPSPRHEVR